MADNNLPVSNYQGKLRLGSVELDCHVLDDEKRVLVAKSMISALSGGVAKHRDRERVFDRIPNASNKLKVSTKVAFRGPGGVHHGYDAEYFVAVCWAYAKADRAGLLRADQKHYADNALRILEALGAVGIVALIDEATGYQRSRPDDELQRKFAAWIHDVPPSYRSLFVSEFWDALAQLHGLQLSGRGRPFVFAAFLKKFFYEFFDADVYAELKRREPQPRDHNTLHRLMRDRPREVFAAHQQVVIALMRASENPTDFENRFNAAFRGGMLQMRLGLN